MNGASWASSSESTSTTGTRLRSASSFSTGTRADVNLSSGASGLLLLSS